MKMFLQGMRQLRVFFYMMLICFITTAPSSVSAEEMTSEFNFGTGYRADKLNWNIANDLSGTSTPNILSELTWDNLGIIQIGGGMRTEVDHIVFKVDADYGWIVSGNNQDSDFDGNHRTLEFSRSNNDGGAGNVWEVSTAIGYRFGEDISITPLAGWAIHRQNLRIRNGFQTIATAGRTPSVGPIAGLDSHYDAQWTAPWLGFDAGMALGDSTRIRVNFAYNFTTYSADANWNLRTDLAHPVSFHHDATGYGIDVGADVMQKLSDDWSLDAGFQYRKYKADNGTDTTFAAAGGSSSTRLNEVNWESVSGSIDAVFNF